MIAEQNKIDVLGENLTTALETVEGFLAQEVEATQEAARAKMDAYDEEADAKINSLKKNHTKVMLIILDLKIVYDIFK